MPAEFDGMTIQVTLSSARPREAEHRGMTVEEANGSLKRSLVEELGRKYPGAEVTVEMGGDRPAAEISGVDDIRRARLIQYDVEKTGLALKWAFSTLGQGVIS